MSEWKETTLNDIAINFAMGPFGSNIKAENFVSSGVPVIKGKNLNFFKYVSGDFDYLTKKKADELGNSNCYPGDLVFTHRGTLGQVCIIPHNQYSRFVISQSGMKVTLNNNLASNDFMLYFFKSDIGQHELLKNESQVGVPSISCPLSSLKAVSLLLPPLEEQKNIAEVLSSLDDKIDLLHRQNKTLENLAETLFRHYFIDNAQDDWEEEPLDKIANYLNGLACQKYPPKNDIEKLPVLKIKELKAGISENSDWATSIVPKEYIVKNGDIIFSWSGSLLVKIWDGKDSILNQHLFKVTSSNYPKWFIYNWTKYHLDKFTAIAESKATTMGHIKRSDLSNSMVMVPPHNELQNINEIMFPIFEKSILNNNQIYELEKIRDMLVEKLISGDVRLQHEEAV